LDLILNKIVSNKIVSIILILNMKSTRDLGLAGLLLLPIMACHQELPRRCYQEDNISLQIENVPALIPPTYSEDLSKHILFLTQQFPGPLADFLSSYQGDIVFLNSDNEDCNVGSNLAEISFGGFYRDNVFYFNFSWPLIHHKHTIGVNLLEPLKTITYYEHTSKKDNTVMVHSLGKIKKPYWSGWDSGIDVLGSLEHTINHEFGHYLSTQGLFEDDQLEELSLIPPCLMMNNGKDSNSKPQVTNYFGHTFEEEKCTKGHVISNYKFLEHVNVYFLGEILTALRLFQQTPTFSPGFEEELVLASKDRKVLEYLSRLKAEQLENPHLGIFDIAKIWGDDRYNRHLELFVQKGILTSEQKCCVA